MELAMFPVICFKKKKTTYTHQPEYAYFINIML